MVEVYSALVYPYKSGFEVIGDLGPDITFDEDEMKRGRYIVANDMCSLNMLTKIPVPEPNEGLVFLWNSCNDGLHVVHTDLPLELWPYFPQATHSMLRFRLLNTVNRFLDSCVRRFHLSIRKVIFDMTHGMDLLIPRTLIGTYRDVINNILREKHGVEMGDYYTPAMKYRYPKDPIFVTDSKGERLFFVDDVCNPKNTFEVMFEEHRYNMSSGYSGFASTVSRYRARYVVGPGIMTGTMVFYDRYEHNYYISGTASYDFEGNEKKAFMTMFGIGYLDENNRLHIYDIESESTITTDIGDYNVLYFPLLVKRSESGDMDYYFFNMDDNSIHYIDDPYHSAIVTTYFWGDYMLSVISGIPVIR